MCVRLNAQEKSIQLGLTYGVENKKGCVAMDTSRFKAFD
jgi:hypothetical protein